MPTEEIIVVPLANCFWGGNERRITSYLKLRRKEEGQSLAHLDYHYFLSEKDKNVIRQCVCYLEFRENYPRLHPKDGKSVSILTNLFATLLWIAGCQGVTPVFRFSKGNPERGMFGEFLDKYRRNPKDKSTKLLVSDKILDVLTDIYPIIVDMSRRNSRLYSAMVFTYNGCVAPNWQVAYICHMASMEAILTNDTKRGRTEQLACGFGYLMADDLDTFYRCKKTFEKHYRIRCDILHGNSYTLTESDRNLENLAILAQEHKRVWLRILQDKDILDNLDADGKAREEWFRARQSVVADWRHKRDRRKKQGIYHITRP